MLKVEAETGETPPALRNRPRLLPWLLMYYSAFMELTHSRIVHQGGIGYIPLSEYVAYMEMVRIDDIEERELFIKMVKALDSVYVERVNADIRRRAETARQGKSK